MFVIRLMLSTHIHLYLKLLHNFFLYYFSWFLSKPTFNFQFLLQINCYVLRKNYCLMYLYRLIEFDVLQSAKWAQSKWCPDNRHKVRSTAGPFCQMSLLNVNLIDHFYPYIYIHVMRPCFIESTNNPLLAYTQVWFFIVKTQSWHSGYNPKLLCCILSIQADVLSSYTSLRCSVSPSSVSYHVLLCFAKSSILLNVVVCCVVFSNIASYSVVFSNIASYCVVLCFPTSHHIILCFGF